VNNPRNYSASAGPVNPAPEASPGREEALLRPG
jgi:hypothetical protein